MIPANLTLWYSTESEVLADWFISNTSLSTHPNLDMRPLAMSDASRPRDFHAMPARIKDILYLDSPDIILSINHVPVMSLEISLEAGTGHNAFQRFSRLAAAVENGVAAFYIYPEAAWINRKGKGSWDVINPQIFKTLENTMRIFGVPAFIYFHPTDFQGDRHKLPSKDAGPKGHFFEKDPHYPLVPDSTDPQMVELFQHVEEILKMGETQAAKEIGAEALTKSWAQKKRDWMISEWARREDGKVWSPVTATSVVRTEVILEYLAKYAEAKHDFGELLNSREMTLIYHPKERYRKQGDPYTGCLAALDYLLCREGKSYEDRSMNLFIAFGDLIFEGEKLIAIDGPAEVSDYVSPVQELYKSTSKVLLGLPYKKLFGSVPRYMMQVRHGTSFTKRKDLRIYAYFADAIMFPDGALWREA